MDTGTWLRGLGLGEYETAFRENAIDDTVLPTLTAEDLKDLGVVLVGHRRKLLNAIAALATAAEDEASAPLTALPEENRLQADAERRHVTVMFSDLVDSTAMSARMDPEDLREVISAYQECAAEVVRRFDGYVAKFLGDGVLAYFGYPQAHEDDAEKAALAGLDLVASVTALKTHAPLKTRVGIATGLVVVGDLIGSGDAQERSIVGQTPNLAARLQGLADPNMVVIDQSTRRLIGDLFDLSGLGGRDLKGIARPVESWAVLRRSTVSGRFEALRARGMIALVGRDEELELLLRRWARAKAGEGQVVLLSGEAGIGKSRLTAALLENVADEQHARLRCFCSPQHTDSAFFPIIGHMERAAGFAHGDTIAAKLDKLDALLAQTATSGEIAALVAEMLHLPNDGRYPELDLSGQQRRQMTLETLILQIERLARVNPVLVLLEDAHWADPTSLELFGRIVTRIGALPVLLIVTSRPEYQSPWVGRPNVTAMTLNRLAAPQIEAMIDHIIGNHVLAAEIRENIIERADGIPLFVEEVTKAVVEAGGQHAAEHAIAAIPSHAQTVPATLYASLMARLDRLGPGKEIAQMGAAIGREFSHALLASVARRQKVAALEEALSNLLESGLVLRLGEPPHATYLFKHALVQDAAYGTLLREARRSLHAHIAETVESEFAEIAGRHPELLGRHYSEAGLVEQAVRFWSKAGRRSLERSALAEAAEQLSRALTLIGELPTSAELRREEIELQVALVTPLMHVKGYGAIETKEAAARARLLIEQAEAAGEPPDDPLLMFSILYSFWVANFNAFNGEVVIDLATEFLARAEAQDAAAARLVGHRLLGVALMNSGAIVQGQQHLAQALELYDPAQHRQLATRFGQDARVAILCFRSWINWIVGFPDAALADVDLALADARETNQAVELMYALNFTTFTLIHCGSYAKASAQLAELAVLTQEKSASQWRGGGMMHEGCILSLTGHASAAVPKLRSGIEAWRATGSVAFVTWSLANLATSYADLGQLDDAQKCLGEALATVEATKERWCEAEIYRVAGELALKFRQPDAAKAEGYFERALALAKAQEARSWELRTAMSMARLWQGQGKESAARKLLGSVYGEFAEGFDTRDLREARALLETLN